MRGVFFNEVERETFDWFVAELETLAASMPPGLGATVKRSGRTYVELSTQGPFGLEAQPHNIAIDFGRHAVGDLDVDVGDRAPFLAVLALFDAVGRGRVREVTLLKPKTALHVVRLNSFGEKGFWWLGTDLFSWLRRKPIRHVKVRRDPQLQAALNA